MAKTTKTTKTGTAPVSKYAAKKAMLAKGIIPNSTIADNVETKVKSTTLAEVWEKYKDTPFMKIVKDMSSGDLKNEDEILKEIDKLIALEKEKETATNEIKLSKEVTIFTKVEGGTLMTESDADNTYSKTTLIKDCPKFTANTDPIDTPTVNVIENKTRQVGKVLIVGHGPISKALEKNIATYTARDSSYGVSSDKDVHHTKVEQAIKDGEISVDHGTAIHKALDADMKRQMEDHKKIADEIARDGSSISKELEGILNDIDIELLEARYINPKLLITNYGRETLRKNINNLINLGEISTLDGLKLLEIVNNANTSHSEEEVDAAIAVSKTPEIPKSKLDRLQSMVTKRDPVKKQQVIPTEVDTHATINPNSKDKRKSGLPDSSAPYPEHVTELALLMKNNAEIRRFTALAIVTYLAQKKIISGNRPNVTFKWDNFTVKVNGFQRTYKYTEGFFLNCLMVAFVSFSKSAQNTIGRFTKVEKNKEFAESIDLNEITRLASLIEPKTKSK